MQHIKSLKIKTLNERASKSNICCNMETILNISNIAFNHIKVK